MSLSVTSVKFENSFSVVDKVLHRSSRSQKFFKVGVLKNFPLLAVLRSCVTIMCVTHVLRSLILIGLKALGLHFYLKKKTPAQDSSLLQIC